MTQEELIAEGQRLKKCLGRKASSSLITDVSTWETQCTFMLDSVKASGEVRNRLVSAFANFKYHSYKEPERVDEIIGILKGIPSGEQARVVANDTGKTKNYEVITKGDHQQLSATNFDRKSINIESLIRIIRGQKVMVDFDLAMLYGVQNKRLNEQVKRNIKRFPDDFMFQLTKEEWNILKSQIATAKQPDNQSNGILKSQNATSSWGGTRKLPYAFTRNKQGTGICFSNADWISFEEAKAKYNSLKKERVR